MKNLPLSDPLADARAKRLKDITRRLIPFEDPDAARLLKCEDGVAEFGHSIPDDPVPLVVKSRYLPGDIVYHGECLIRDAGGFARYRRSESRVNAEGVHAVDVPWRWQRAVLPSRFCPLQCARLFSRVVDARAERLHEITEDDARREGMTTDSRQGTLNGEPATLYPMSHRQAFIWTWDAINAKRAPWRRNDWVFRIELEHLTREEALRA